jgi:hypothetical protein
MKDAILIRLLTLLEGERWLNSVERNNVAVRRNGCGSLEFCHRLSDERSGFSWTII